MMTYRNIEALAFTENFELFLQKHDLGVRIESGQIFVKGTCVLMHIYSFNIENIVYWDIYIEDGQRYSNIDRVLSVKDTEESARVIHSFYKQSHIHNATPLVHASGLNNTLAAERLFFTYLDLADTYLIDLLRCDFSYYELSFSISEEARIRIIAPYL